mmetsp:Transcript_33678/g.67071  ORF Transcript_33678/g.67071 Transcript_33678/m.67071 type:complete len:204 (+) Transcript_33678:678-1289(+)
MARIKSWPLQHKHWWTAYQKAPPSASRWRPCPPSTSSNSAPRLSRSWQVITGVACYPQTERRTPSRCSLVWMEGFERGPEPRAIRRPLKVRTLPNVRPHQTCRCYWIAVAAAAAARWRMGAVRERREPLLKAQQKAGCSSQERVPLPAWLLRRRRRRRGRRLRWRCYAAVCRVCFLRPRPMMAARLLLHSSHLHSTAHCPPSC